MILIAVLARGTTAMAAANEAPGIGWRGFTMRGAYTAIADDWTAIYWNPGGLAFLEGKGLGAFFVMPFPTFYDGNSIKNFDPGNFSLDQADIFQRIYPTEPRQFREKEMSPTVVVTGLGFYRQIADRWVLGGGNYTPFGTFIQWKNEVFDPVTKAKIAADYFRFWANNVTNLSLATRLSDTLSVGFGLNLVLNLTQLDAKKRYLGSSQPQSPDYLFKNKARAFGWGLEGTGGLMYRPTPRWSFSAVYRSGTKVKLKGEMGFRHTAFGLGDSSGFDQDFYQPATYGLGTAYRVTPKLTLSFDWQQTDWTTTKIKMNFDRNRSPFRDMDEDMDWQRSNRYRLGAAYLFNEKWTLRMGYFFDQYATPGRALNLINVIDTDFHYLSWGLEYQRNRWVWGAGMNHSFGKREVEGHSYRLKAPIAILLNCSYRF